MLLPSLCLTLYFDSHLPPINAYYQRDSIIATIISCQHSVFRHVSRLRPNLHWPPANHFLHETIWNWAWFVCSTVSGSAITLHSFPSEFNSSMQAWYISHFLKIYGETVTSEKSCFITFKNFIWQLSVIACPEFVALLWPHTPVGNTCSYLSNARPDKMASCTSCM